MNLFVGGIIITHRRLLQLAEDCNSGNELADKIQKIVSRGLNLPEQEAIVKWFHKRQLFLGHKLEIQRKDMRH